ncbi:stalk domain-containing protein [Paenibacillus physcomitrellae]
MVGFPRPSPKSPASFSKLVPVRLISESFGIKVDWDKTSRTVHH